MEDSKIIELYFARDEEAIAQTETAYGKRLFYLSKNIIQDAQDAEESVNDTYWKAWTSIPPQHPRHLFGYLAQICRNLTLNRLDWKNASKRTAQVVCLTEEMHQCIPDSRQTGALEAEELGELLDAFLRSLSAENRMVFLRRYWYADSIAEIANRYGISENAVQKRLTRTKASLYTYLEKEGFRI